MALSKSGLASRITTNLNAISGLVLLNASLQAAVAAAIADAIVDEIVANAEAKSNGATETHTSGGAATITDLPGIIT